MNLSPEERAVGRENYYDAVGTYEKTNRREFIKDVIGTALVGGAGLGAMYFGYGKPSNPVRIGIIGTGDEGGILIGALNPDYVDVVAICDIRPSSIHRAFEGDYGGGDPERTHELRPGLRQVYGWTEQQAHDHVAVYYPQNQDPDMRTWQQLLANSDVEGVIIALPLHLHAKVAVAALQAGKHVLTEKLMAHNIAQCKVMARVADATGLYLATGHQRHYNILYDNAVNLIRWGVLGQIHHIRAQWHRGNLPGRDSWAPPIPGGQTIWGSNKTIDPIKKELDDFAAQKKKLEELMASGRSVDAKEYAIISAQHAQWKRWDEDKTVEAAKFDYVDEQLQDPHFGSYTRTALEELVRWRLWNRTGGGLMAELGSHQLDAASIFISAMNRDKVHPLTVHAVGGRHIFPPDRDADDHVYCTFEFPGSEYVPGFDVGYNDPITGVGRDHGVRAYHSDPSKRVVVTYSSINGNGFGGYGEVVMGTKGTLVLDREQTAMLYGGSTATRVSVKDDKGGPTLDTQESGDGGVAKAAEQRPVSRGYQEEIEHWAWCIRNQDPEVQPRCQPKVAVADAVIALTARYAAENSGKGKNGFVQFKEEWFDIASDAIPEDSDYIQEKKLYKGTSEQQLISVALEKDELGANI